jgi:hypothetical protein
MRILFKFFTYLFIFFIGIFLFLPKESIYFYLERVLLEKKIVISNENISEKFSGINISNGNIYYENINVANVKEIDIETFLLYTSIKIEDVKLLKSLESFSPSPIDEILIKYSLIDFDKIKLSANGSFGEINGSIDIFTRVLNFELIASNKMKNEYSGILKNMQIKEGRYYYEYKF